MLVHHMAIGTIRILEIVNNRTLMPFLNIHDVMREYLVPENACGRFLGGAVCATTDEIPAIAMLQPSRPIITHFIATVLEECVMWLFFP